MHSKEHSVLAHPATFRPKDWLRFVQIDPFPRLWSGLKLDDEDLRLLEIGIMSLAESAVVISGTNGLRKVRFAKKESNRGKSSSYRIYFIYFPEYGVVLLMAVIAKSDKADLTKADLQALAQVIARYKTLMDQGVIR